GVARIDECLHIGTLDELDEQLESGFVALDRTQIEMRRDHGQLGKRPFATFDLELLRNAQLEQMAHRRRKDKVVAFVIIVVLLESAQSAGDVSRYRRFFCDN